MSPCVSYSFFSWQKSMKARVGPTWKQEAVSEARNWTAAAACHDVHSFKLKFNRARSTVDPLIDGVTPLPLSLPFHFPLLHKPHSLYCSFLTSIYSVLSPFLSTSTQQMSVALWSTAGMFVWAGQCLSVPGFLVESERSSILTSLAFGDKKPTELIGIAHSK